ncbi:MAG: hypothetical protein JJU11_13260 [Candidatus Sumerlaeia bacterium]|nr:hypothetical protein [Candidatus Sumerlaeia bacterium]
MLCTCQCSEASRSALGEILGVGDSSMLQTVEVEFKELPYFLVSRSRAKWDPESQGDINDVELVSVTEKGLLVAPDGAGDAEGRRTLIPWQNVISLSTTRTNKGSD